MNKQTLPILRTAKDYNSDPQVSFNLKFRTDAGTFYKVGYVLVYPDGAARYFSKKASAQEHLRFARAEWPDYPNAEDCSKRIEEILRAFDRTCYL